LKSEIAVSMAVKAVMLVTLLAMAAVCAAKEWEVEWKLPNSENTYSVFQQKPFNVGDTLKFTYMQEMHNVVEVGSEEDYKQCTMTKPLSPEFADGHTSMKLSKPGVHYYICSIPTHCTDGMKLKVQAIEPKHHN
jgi:plastocyanin